MITGAEISQALAAAMACPETKEYGPLFECHFRCTEAFSNMGRWANVEEVGQLARERVLEDPEDNLGRKWAAHIDGDKVIVAGGGYGYIALKESGGAMLGDSYTNSIIATDRREALTKLLHMTAVEGLPLMSIIMIFDKSITNPEGAIKSFDSVMSQLDAL